MLFESSFFFFQAEDGIRDATVTGVQTCALPISPSASCSSPGSPIDARSTGGRIPRSGPHERDATDELRANVREPERQPGAIALKGSFRDGCCSTGPEDVGSHTVCAVMTAEFLEFSRLAGNDLSTPRPEWGFEGIHAGDRWCLCASRWLEAYEAGQAPEVVLGATHVRALEGVPIEALTA